MKIENSTIAAVAFAALAFVLGFGYGNLLGLEYEFRFQEWQTLTSAIVAIGLGMLAFFGVWSTQRVNVMIKEQERIDAMLPGLRQVDELLRSLQRPLRELRPQTRHESQTFINSVFGVNRDEGLDVAVRRSLSLADERLRDEVVRQMFVLRNQAALLRIRKGEMDQALMDLAERDQFSPSVHAALREKVDTSKANYDLEAEKVGVLLDGLDRFISSIHRRISQGEMRLVIIRKVLNRFFGTNGD